MFYFIAAFISLQLRFRVRVAIAVQEPARLLQHFFCFTARETRAAIK